MPLPPALILVSAQHAEFLADEFGRYRRDYDLRTAGDSNEALAVAEQVVAAGGQVAMFVADSRLPADNLYQVITAWRAVVPTARRVIVADWSVFGEDAPRYRAGMAAGKYDAFLLMPRGARDEEFHFAITDLLSEWGSTVAGPEVDTVRIIAPAPDGGYSRSATSWTGWACPTARIHPTPSRGARCSTPMNARTRGRSTSRSSRHWGARRSRRRPPGTSRSASTASRTTSISNMSST